MNSKSIIISITLFALGALAGTFLAPSGTRTLLSAENEAQESTTSSPISDAGSAATIASLRARIAELESALSAQGNVRDADTPVREGASAQGKDSRRMGPPSREEMKKWEAEHPEEAAKMKKEMEKRMAEHKEREAARRDFISSVDTSSWSYSAKKNHSSYLAAKEKQEELMEQMHNPDLTDDERDSIFQQMRENGQSLRSMADTERENLLSTAVENSGITGDAAEELISTIQDVYEATQQQGGRGGPGGPGGGMPPGGGPGPR